ncbi:hypothetical protein KUTeg_021107 [Tegillarca granosa]|uniref:Protein GAMETE EXPRESSED 1 n=1 Tax=Tegillarca granosa TaxID=220873 RepID=A0ABQ9EAC4_TEGGR|nr:hypothetical protein KUTeg_021107 [Tegillarca granosa]
MPMYGQCWKDAIIKIQKGCKQLSDVMQSRLALAYLNCFLKMQERPMYECEWDQPVAECTRNMIDVDRSSYTTFFTHTQNICYFLESQVWHEETEKTINRLASSSEEVALQIEQSSELQSEMIKTQRVILDKAMNLSDVISSSHKMFEEFRATSNEQRLLINDVFDKVEKLQAMVLGEFSGFYSIIYYTLSIVMAYLLTSTPRTSTARFWLFGIMTINIIAERVIISCNSMLHNARFTLGMPNAGVEELVYTYQWFCRKISTAMAIMVLVACAYRYKDINILNNQLLIDIKQQISDLRKIGQRTDHEELDDPSVPQIADADTTGYDSDSAVSSCSNFSSLSHDTDYLPSEYHTPPSELSYAQSSSSDTNSSSLMQELEDIRSATPVRELSKRISSWLQNSHNRHSTPVPVDETSPSSSNEKPRRSRSRSRTPDFTQFLGQTRYFLRPRKQQGQENPMVASESPSTFSRVVKSLERIAMENNRRSKFVHKRHQEYSDSEED